MPRSRNLHSDISLERKLNQVSEFAALLYTWGIAHARDNCRLPKRDPEALRLLIFPGRTGRTAGDIELAFGELIDAELVGVDDDGFYFYPDEVFYKYQSYINIKNRRPTPKLNKINTAAIDREVQKRAERGREGQTLPEKGISPSPSPSLSHSETASAVSSRAREDKSMGDDGGSKIDDRTTTPPIQNAKPVMSGVEGPKTENGVADLGLGENHPAALVGAELWGKLENFWRGQGKKIGIYQYELWAAELRRFKKRGSDPVRVVETALRNGWMQLHELDESDRAPPEGEKVMSFADIKRRAAERAKETA